MKAAASVELPSSLWGGVGGGGRVIFEICAFEHRNVRVLCDPHPCPFPARGKGTPMRKSVQLHPSQTLPPPPQSPNRLFCQREAA